MIKVGILELQGDFGLHHKILQELGYDSYSVKESADLESLDGLIIPGGESTTMSLLIDSFNLRKSILDFSKENPPNRSFFAENRISPELQQIPENFRK